MEHHHEKKENINNLYYLVGLVFGLITGVVIDRSFTWVIVCGVLGLLLAAFFLNILVKGREDV